VEDIPAILAIAAAAVNDPSLADIRPVIRKSVFNSAKGSGANFIKCMFFI
jgi:hypothetical protein